MHHEITIKQGSFDIKDLVKIDHHTVFTKMNARHTQETQENEP